MKRIGNIGNILIAATAVLVIPRMAGEVQRLVAERFGQTFDRIDPNGVYIWASIHHVVQLLLTIGLMLVFVLIRFQDESNGGRVSAWQDHAELIHSLLSGRN